MIVLAQFLKIPGVWDWHMHTLAKGDLCYSTGNFTQYSVTTYMGKESEKRMNACTCKTESQKLSQHCKSTIFQ